MSSILDERAPYLEKTQYGDWEVNFGTGNHLRVNCSVDDVIEIDKLYGPLSALGVRIRLVYPPGDWVVERQRPIDKTRGDSDMEWVEVTRWNCQQDWWTKEDENGL